MSKPETIQVLPYSRVVGQEHLKRALELVYIAPGIGGVLISGQRGTAKSTAVRAFSRMAFGDLPVTLPINATDDRVIGGWKIDQLMRENPEFQKGLLEKASERGLLYVDEVNLLDDHLVNLILDAASTGILSVQREALDEQKAVTFTLVGTMNPEEGGLRPQLLDRFGLSVAVETETNPARRREILNTVLRFDEAKAGRAGNFTEDGIRDDALTKQTLTDAKSRLYQVDVPVAMIALCADVAQHFQAPGHRADYAMALAARAYAAQCGASRVQVQHVREVAPLALQHRRPSVVQGGRAEWTADDQNDLQRLLDATN